MYMCADRGPVYMEVGKPCGQLAHFTEISAHAYFLC